MGVGEGAKTASQTGGEGEPGDEVSGTPVREVSKVPEGRWVSLRMERVPGHQAPVVSGSILPHLYRG